MSRGAGMPAHSKANSPAELLTQSGDERLWTPWRMKYVAEGTREDGCIFCNRLASDDDAASLILHRGDCAFVIMNLFPYNTGHVMIVPNAHVASPEDVDGETMAAMGALRAPVLRAIRRALGPAGFNLGLNVGAVAGAGVTDHLHEHVVPRWEGDANFMPILASTMVMPELIPVTYAKLRAELSRELAGDNTVIVLVQLDGDRMLVDAHGRLPRASAEEGEPLWRAALRDTLARGAEDVDLVGWSGNGPASQGPNAFLLRAHDLGNLHGEYKSTPIDKVRRGPDGGLLGDGTTRPDSA